MILKESYMQKLLVYRCDVRNNLVNSQIFPTSPSMRYKMKKNI